MAGASPSLDSENESQRSPLDSAVQSARDAAAGIGSQLARLLRLPPAHAPKRQAAGDRERAGAHALAGPSRPAGAEEALLVPDSLRSPGLGSSQGSQVQGGAAGRPAGAGGPPALHDSFSSSHGSQHVQAALPEILPGDREELGRATWTLLHTLAAQFPDKPSRQQQKDARTLVDVMTRIYPCAECAEHFREVVRSMPPEVATGGALRQWMCRAHNVVNRSLDKPAFNCALVDARWGALYCGEELACDLALGKPRRHS